MTSQPKTVASLRSMESYHWPRVMRSTYARGRFNCLTPKMADNAILSQIPCKLNNLNRTIRNPSHRVSMQYTRYKNQPLKTQARISTFTPIDPLA